MNVFLIIGILIILFFLFIIIDLKIWWHEYQNSLVPEDETDS